MKLDLVGSRYYDSLAGRFLTPEERFPNAYSDEDDGAAMITFFQLASMVPVAGAPFELAMAFDSNQNGDYVGGALGIVGGVLNAVPAAELVGALREVADLGAGLRKTSRVLSEGNGTLGIQVGKDPAGKQDLLQLSRRWDKDPAGMFDVAIHGTADYGMMNGFKVEAHELADLIRRDPQFNGQKIRLLSCNAGAKAGGFAQKLADSLGVEVFAPSNILNVDKFGNW